MDRGCSSSAPPVHYDGNTITQDRKTLARVDRHFSLRLKDQKTTDQKGTGRCWMFSGLNVFRPAAAGTRRR
jgi:bleomycin hydrolase